jgi:hypothetical protein
MNAARELKVALPRGMPAIQLMLSEVSVKLLARRAFAVALVYAVRREA